MSGDYKKVQMRPRPKTSSITGENRYWQHFKNPVNTKHFNKITDIEFSPLEPYDFAVTSSTRVEIYDSLTCSKKKSLSRFPDVAYSGSYRGSDGKVLVAGCEDSKIRVYDLSSRVVLRTLVGHTAPVKTVRFLTEQRFLLSGSDDNSVRTWDMTTEQNLDVLRGHTDYVRSVSEHTDFSAFCFLSAGYDHTVRYWDRRLSNRGGQACIFVLDHGAPVEDCLVLPNHGQGDLLATAGGNEVQIWSLKMASSAPATSQRTRMHRASNHQKTCMALSYDHTTDRLLSAGLDHMVKIYDMRPSLTGTAGGAYEDPAAAAASSAPVSSFATAFMQVTHSMKFSGPILATAISPDSRVLVVGMADGALSMRSRDHPQATPGGIIAPRNLAESLREDVAYQTPLPPAKTGPKPGSRAYYARGASYDPASATGDDDAPEADFRIARVRRAKLAPYDLLLKSFKYHAALDAAVATSKATIIVAMLDELINRNALLLALSNRDASSLLPLLHFTAKYLPHPSYASILVEVVNLVLDLYAPLLGTVLEFDEVFYRIANQVLAQEIETQKNCITIQAFMDNISSRSELKAWETDDDENDEEMAREESTAQDGEEDEEDETSPSTASQSSSEESAPVANGTHAKRKPTEEPEQDSDVESEEEEDAAMSDAAEEAPAKKKQSSKQQVKGAPKIAAVTSSESDAEEEEAPKRKGKKVPAAAANGKAKKQKI